MTAKMKKNYKKYEIVDVDESNKEKYCVCFEDWSDDMKEAGNHKACWYEKMKDKGLGVKLVRDSDGELCGMIQYVPAEFAPLTGTGFYFIYCIWVHGHKKGLGNRAGAGMGTALLEAAEEDIRKKGVNGIAAWGLSMPFWMKASWYKKHGYQVVQKDGMSRLLWKPLVPGMEEPRWLESKKKPDASAENKKVVVTSIRNGICPVMNLAYERSKKAAGEFADSVVFQEVVTDDPEVLREWGVSDALYINDTEVPLGPPVSEKKIKDLIMKQLKEAGR